MKKRAALLTAFLACAATALLIAWLTSRGVSSVPTAEASFGVIETRQFQARSRIILYDSELNELGDLPLDYATLGCDWNLSPVYDGTLYVIPQGYTTKRDEKTVLGVDLDDLSITRYSVDQINLYGVCADDDYVFTCSNLNNVSHISRVGRQTGDVTDIGETGVYIESLCLYGERLYAFASNSSLSSDVQGTSLSAALDESSSWISIYDRDLRLIDTVTTTKLGSGRFRPVAAGGMLFFANWEDASGEVPSTQLGVYHTDTGVLEPHDFGKPVLDALPWNGCVLLLFGDIHSESPTTAALYGPTTWEPLTEEHDLTCAVMQSCISGDTLYVVGAERELLSFDLKDSLSPLGRSTVSHIDGDFSYVSGMFAVPA
ncbi:MAG: hypothetical protein LKI67_05050 [Olsenella sp.]|jgi:hypothetical protein|nr:hypothetical protein [Olsenella sp.]MCI1792482.1 hypothetical protein [Olsenella sp.]MCI1811207.1 hypothetical protein [Olsenella sp.]MCI1879876.1 hypothetical protein [Olsenella sp.]